MATKRIKKQYAKIVDSGRFNVKLINKEDIFNWKATLDGPINSPYKFGTFQLHIHFPQYYPFRPMQIKFMNKIYHPNINFQQKFKGLKVLVDEWPPQLTTQRVLQMIENLLQSPNLENALYPQIVDQYLKNWDIFQRKAKQCTLQNAIEDNF